MAVPRSSGACRGELLIDLGTLQTSLLGTAGRLTPGRLEIADWHAQETSSRPQDSWKRRLYLCDHHQYSASLFALFPYSVRVFLRVCDYAPECFIALAVVMRHSFSSSMPPSKPRHGAGGKCKLTSYTTTIRYHRTHLQVAGIQVRSKQASMVIGYFHTYYPTNISTIVNRTAVTADGIQRPPQMPV